MCYVFLINYTTSYNLVFGFYSLSVSSEEIDSVVPCEPSENAKEDQDDDYEPARTRSKKNDDIQLSIPRKQLLKGTAELAARCKL